ncbi:hypothetical protein BX666DRAFT_1967612 [Dichotomocladium elegans]|nr:hypothetical protein BX666DRAFT_1967612 [Dichotomocladium elegans]
MALFNVPPPAFDLGQNYVGCEALFDKHRNADKKQIRALLRNSKFRLIKVERGETQIDEHRKEIKSLTVVTPAFDPRISEDVERWGWHSLSHVWGPKEEWIEWNDTGVIDGDTGAPLNVRVHPSKPQEMTSLLQIQYISYWWIDVFCARSDTPLVIMGDIYKHCTSCYTLIDGPYQVGQDEVSKPLSNAATLSEQYLEEAARGYIDAICKTYTDNGVVVPAKWSQLLKDLLNWPSGHLERGVNEQLDDWRSYHVKGSNAANFFDALMPLSLDEKIEFAEQFFSSKKYQPWNFRSSAETCLLTLRSFKSEKLAQARNIFADFLDCRWTSRVWTLQEFALPHSKAVTPPGSGSCDFTMWLPILRAFSKVMEKAYDIRAAQPMAIEIDTDQRVLSPNQILDIYLQKDPVLARIYSDYRMVLELAITVGYSPDYNTMDDEQERLRAMTMLNSFGTSQRVALFPVDYVYGVLGILDIDLPRFEDPNKVWKIFSKKLQEKYPDVHVPSNVNLGEAKRMQDVYGQLKFPYEKHVTSDAIDRILSFSNVY